MNAPTISHIMGDMGKHHYTKAELQRQAERRAKLDGTADDGNATTATADNRPSQVETLAGVDGVSPPVDTGNNGVDSAPTGSSDAVGDTVAPPVGGGNSGSAPRVAVRRNVPRKGRDLRKERDERESKVSPRRSIIIDGNKIKAGLPGFIRVFFKALNRLGELIARLYPWDVVVQFEGVERDESEAITEMAWPGLEEILPEAIAKAPILFSVGGFAVFAASKARLYSRTGFADTKKKPATDVQYQEAGK